MRSLENLTQLCLKLLKRELHTLFYDVGVALLSHLTSGRKSCDPGQGRILRGWPRDKHEDRRMAGGLMRVRQTHHLRLSLRKGWISSLQWRISRWHRDVLRAIMYVRSTTLRFCSHRMHRLDADGAACPICTVDGLGFVGNKGLIHFLPQL